MPTEAQLALLFASADWLSVRVIFGLHKQAPNEPILGEPVAVPTPVAPVFKTEQQAAATLGPTSPQLGCTTAGSVVADTLGNNLGAQNNHDLARESDRRANQEANESVINSSISNCLES